MPSSTYAQQQSKGYLGFCPDPVGEATNPPNYIITRVNTQPLPELDATLQGQAQVNLGFGQSWLRYGRVAERKG